ncbi:carbohydrate ABC transporter permease [Paenibacillus sp. BC26]|uniref:carbohydrate ABC transporter permease n=1 Tax=Paenibacillus sp. BC26 TaxID=1881032 RepID=UPI0008E68D85|nr:carbohydrate ABC transporter permease [Paenibacillus sp. BC26]SFT05780.1 carbohydrate ABC transporter membrane protein 2, CUT1 family [Paenibacillus sp. BC26]
MKQKASFGSYSFSFINSTVFILFALLCIFPLYYIFVLTVSDNKWVASGALVVFPKGFNVQNYVHVLKLDGIGMALWVTILKTVVGTACTLAGSSFLAFLFTKPHMLMRKFLYRFVLVTMYFNAGLIPWFINIKNLHLMNTFAVYIIPYIVAPFYIILIKTFLESIPSALEESAQIDGAGIFRVFWSILVPLSKPILATVAVFESVNQWNNLRDNLFLITDSRLNTLQFVLYKFMSEADALASKIMVNGGAGLSATNFTLTPTAVSMTIAMVVILPIVCIYPIMQRYFTKGIMLGAVKG